MQVVVDRGRDLAEREPLGGGAGHRHVSWRSRSLRRSTVPVAVEQQRGGAAEPAPAGDDRELVQLRAVAVRGGDDGVRGLVHRDRLQLVGAEHVRVGARAADDALDRLVEVVHADHRARPERALSSAASLTTFSSSAPVKPGAAAGDRRRRRRPARTGGPSR